jgi:hypothetical protein
MELIFVELLAQRVPEFLVIFFDDFGAVPFAETTTVFIAIFLKPGKFVSKAAKSSDDLKISGQIGLFAI